jgi:multidrug resistance efflux pump
MNYIEHNTEELAEHSPYKSFGKIYQIRRPTRVKLWFWCIMLVLVLVLFLPWTQNIRSNGQTTTFRPDQRPQELNSIIAGRITKWYVREGQTVQAGDTLVQLAEVKADYLDPNLLQRTQEQLVAKEAAVAGYDSKIKTTDLQLEALKEAQVLKIKGLQNKIRQQSQKIRSDSADAMAAQNEFGISTAQLKRQKALYDSGLVSLTQLEQRNQAFQNSLAKRTSTDIKFQNAKQEMLLLQIDLNSANQEYFEKIAKTQGERFSAISAKATGEGDIAKMKNIYQSYAIRQGMYFILAPQTGQVVQAQKQGIGEVVKEGEFILKIVPQNPDFAIEFLVEPMDLPLVTLGQRVRFMFDGFPAVVFSGWPNASIGLFSGRVAAVENTVTSKGKYRILVIPDPKTKPWPPQLQVGIGAKAVILLKDVPLWYELWRSINGFPPDYYKSDSKEKEKKK